MSTQTDNNKRIAKNTLLLYFRMLFLMIVSLYTSRVILNALGVEDFGIYNVVGGIISMFSIISNSLTSAISRFITFELGKKNIEKLKVVFSSAVTIQIVLGLIIIIISETIGLWFLNYKMTIPADRLETANYVFHFSIITFVINLISIPYNAAIIAHEKMSAFAYISIIEVIGKLAIAYFVIISPIDKLIFYAILMALVAIIIRFIYGFYCKRHFQECSYKFIYDKTVLKEMFNFAGWNFWGSGSFILMTQGVNVLINMFFGVIYNAARGIANQVDNAVVMFANNFTTAINPQIIKSYASKDLSYMHKLICAGSKYSFFLLWIFALPLLLETETILYIWLKTVPDYAPSFLRYTISISLLSVISNTLVTAIQATGKIKKYQLIVGGLGMTIFPLVYITYKMGFPVEIAYIIHFSIFILQLISRLFLSKEMINLPILFFVKNVIVQIITIAIISSIIPVSIYLSNEQTIIRFIIILFTSFFATTVSIYFLGLDKNERAMVNTYFHTMIRKLNRNQYEN